MKNNDPVYESNVLVIEDIKSMDGKTANFSDGKSSNDVEVAKIDAISIIYVKNSNCDVTEIIEDKTNEIPTGPEKLKKIDIKNKL